MKDAIMAMKLELAFLCFKVVGCRSVELSEGRHIHARQTRHLLQGRLCQTHAVSPASVKTTARQAETACNCLTSRRVA